MNEAEMFSLAQNFDEDCKFQDFSAPSDEDGQEADGEEFNLTSEAELCLVESMKDFQKTQKLENKLQKVQKNSKNKSKNDNLQKKECKNQSIQKFKDAYFSYYDDIKIPSHKVTDW